MKKLLATFAMLVIMVPACAEDQFSLGAGFDYSSGKYGDRASTDILEIPVTGKYQTGDVTLMLTVPYISVTGPGGVIQGIGRVGQPNTRTTRTTSSGLGDIVTSAGYTFYNGEDLVLDLFGNIKFGTADENQGLGTGKNDYSAQFDGYYTLDTTTLLGTAGYKVYGSPAGIPLTNVPYGMIGFSQELDDKASAGVRLDMEKSPVAFEEDQRYMTVFASQEISSKTLLQIHFMKGFTNSTPDYGFGGMITGYF